MIKICEKRIFIKTKDDYSKEIIGVLRLNNCITKDQYDLIRYNLINQFHECMLIDYRHILELEYGHGFECRVYLSDRYTGGGVIHEQTNETNHISIQWDGKKIFLI